MSLEVIERGPTSDPLSEERPHPSQRRAREWLVLAICAALISIVFAMDVALPIGSAAQLLYIIPVAVALWSPLRRTKYAVAVIVTLLTLIAIPLKPPGEFTTALFNRSAHLLAMWVLVLVADSYVQSRDRAEDARRETEGKFRDMADNMSQLAWMADGTGQIFWYNTRWYDYTGTTFEEMRKGGWRKVFHPDHLDRVGGKIAHCFQTEEPWGDTHPLRSKEGEYHWFLGRAVPIKENGKVVRWFGTHTDITEELEARNELERSNAQLRQFAYVASHDLQEPLRTLTTYLTLIERKMGGQFDDEARQYFAFAVEGGQNARELVRNLLDFSRVDSQGMPFEPTDMGEVMQQVRENLKVQAEELKAIVTVDPLPVVMADEGQMITLMQNLVSNALKFHGPVAPRVHVTAQEKADEWVFGVKDNGIGIEPQYGEKIFMIFQRLHTNEEYPGTGIGLAISKKIVERHGGRIWFDSERGQGTAFYFTIGKGGGA